MFFFFIAFFQWTELLAIPVFVACGVGEWITNSNIDPRTQRLHLSVESAWLIMLACWLFQAQLHWEIRQTEAASCYSDAVSLTNYDQLLFTEQNPRRSFTSHNVSKVYHVTIKLINGTAAEQMTGLKPKYTQMWEDRWFMSGNYSASSWHFHTTRLYE